ncbi:MAG: hypothetical protein Q7J65_09070, partial [Candidatus Marinimicrobia bacterium]|nr:hypothetical protein [Candidatus Neomarinimicrobiota bacterium]
MTENDLNEMLVHKAILKKPEIIEKSIGIKLATFDNEQMIKHHYPLSDKGEHIDFVFKDISDKIYIAEVKINTNPIYIIPQLYDHEYKKFIQINSDINKDKIVPVVIVDSDSVSENDAEILSKMNIQMCIYDKTEIIEILEETECDEQIVSFEIPDTGLINDFISKINQLKNDYSDLNILLEGFSGNDWWDGYFEFRTFWLWKENKYPKIFQKIFKLLCDGRKEDSIWFTFLTSISDNFDVAEYIIYKKGWDWHRIASNKSKNDLDACLCNSGKWAIQNLFDHKKRIQVVADYLKIIGESQESYFLKLISKVNNPFDAYNSVRESIQSIHNVGPVIACEFSTYIAQWRILPIIPSDNVRESKYVIRGIDNLGIK